MLVAHLEKFDHQGKAHGQVYVGFCNVLVHSFEENGYADRDQELKGKNLQGWIFQNEVSDWLGKGQDSCKRDEDSSNNNPHLVG
jgi:hypothetical protein